MARFSGAAAVVSVPSESDGPRAGCLLGRHVMRDRAIGELDPVVALGAPMGDGGPVDAECGKQSCQGALDIDCRGLVQPDRAIRRAGITAERKVDSLDPGDGCLYRTRIVPALLDSQPEPSRDIRQREGQYRDRAKESGCLLPEAELDGRVPLRPLMLGCFQPVWIRVRNADHHGKHLSRSPGAGQLQPARGLLIPPSRRR